MADEIKMSEFLPSNAITDSDYVIVLIGGKNRKIKFSDFVTGIAIASALPSGNPGDVLTLDANGETVFLPASYITTGVTPAIAFTDFASDEVIASKGTTLGVGVATIAMPDAYVGMYVYKVCYTLQVPSSTPITLTLVGYHNEVAMFTLTSKTIDAGDESGSFLTEEVTPNLIVVGDKVSLAYTVSGNTGGLGLSITLELVRYTP